MPVMISDDLYVSLPAEGLSLDYPRACFENLLKNAVMSASSYLSEEYVPENIVDGNTYDWWRASAMPAWVRGDISTAEDVDFVGIAAHQLGFFGATFVTQYWDGSDWIDCHDPITPVDDRVLMVFFPTVFSNRFRLYITGSFAPPIGVWYVGRAFTFVQKMYVGYTPVSFDTETKKMRNISDGGYDLGRSIVRNGVKNRFEVSHLPGTWVRDVLSPVLEILDTEPFFFAWRPSDYPNEVAYVWTQGARPSPVYTGPTDLMKVSFEVRGMVL